MMSHSLPFHSSPWLQAGEEEEEDGEKEEVHGGVKKTND